MYEGTKEHMPNHMHYQFMASINIKFINSRGDVVAHHLQRIVEEAAAAAAAAAVAATMAE